jgi:hypothetical protein
MSSPPFDQTNGARRMIDGSTPRPYWSMLPSPSSSFVSLIAFWTMSFQVHPSFGSATPAWRNRSRL